MKIIYALNCDEIQVSDCDHLFLSGYNWRKDKQWGYYRCSNGGTWNGHKVNAKPMHWFVAQLMGLKVHEGLEIDHIDRNKTNNQRNNLRVASRSLQKYNINMHRTNTSGFVGVHFREKCIFNPWQTQIMINGKHKNLGCFKTPEEASEVYQAAKKIRDQKEIERIEQLYS